MQNDGSRLFDVKISEKLYLKYIGLSKIDGPLRFPNELYELFLGAPDDPLPEFEGPRNLRKGRGKDHPRYGRWIYAFGLFIKPQLVVEVGTYAGGTAVGWAKALNENGTGEIICIDNDSYTAGTYPEVTKKNIRATGLELSRAKFEAGDSRTIIPRLATTYRDRADIFLVDADHTYQGARADIDNGLPMIRKGGYLLVHDVDKERRMDEATAEHPHPVYEAFMETVGHLKSDWCILSFIRKHLGILRIP